MELFTEKLENITLGADPEVFVRGYGRDISIKSAIGTIGGSKISPRMVNDGAIQEDNVLAEFNIDPVSDPYAFAQKIQSVMGQLSNELSHSNLTIERNVSSHHFEKEYLESLGPEAMEFGCSSEFNAWTEGVMEKPEGSSTTLRTAGGHIHIGYEDPFERGNYSIIKMLDYTLGLPSVLADTDTERRKLYGEAGSMRHKPYGVEYRTLSNFWLRSQQMTIKVAHRTLKSVQDLSTLPSYIEKLHPEELRSIINNSDTKAAHHYMGKLNIQAL